MSHSDIMILRGVLDDDIAKLIKLKNYPFYQFYKHQSSFALRSIRRVWYKMNLPFMSLWYNKDILSSDAKKIVVMDSLCSPEYLRWLRKKKPDARIVFWYWNIAYNSIDPPRISDDLVEKWSFSRKDCIKYKMRFNPLPYFREVVFPSNEIVYDVIFVGKDKGRLSRLLELRDAFDKLKLKTLFVITPDHPYSKNPEYSNRIGYLESMELGTKSKAVLDYIEIDDSGQSLRILEALFMHKKIITNSKLIFDYDFYCPENIFVLGHDDIDKLPDFLSVPYKEMPEEMIMKYDFDSAIARCFDDERTVFDDMLEQMRKSEIDASKY